MSLNFVTKNFETNEDDFKKVALNDLFNFIISIEVDKYTPIPVIRKKLTNFFDDNGFIIKPSIASNSRLSVTAICSHEKTAVCVQLGNAARFYADMMKLQYLYQKNKIDRAIFICFTRAYVKKSPSANLSTFERSIEELEFFNNIIDLPILVIGIDEEI